MNNFINQQALLEGVDPKVKQEYAKLGRDIESALKKQAKIFPQLSIHKSTTPQELYDDAPDSIRFDAKWNKKFMIGFIIAVDIFDEKNRKLQNTEDVDLSPICSVGVDGRGIIPSGSKLVDKLDKTFNFKGGIKTYMHVKRAIDMALDYLPKDEIPEEYRK